MVAYPGELTLHIRRETYPPGATYVIAYVPLDYKQDMHMVARMVLDDEFTFAANPELVLVVLTEMMEEKWNHQFPDMQIVFRRHEGGFELRWKDDATE